MVIRRPTNDHDAHSWKRLMSPFRCPVWIAVFSCFLVSGTFLNILAGSRRISDGLLKAAGVICGQGDLCVCFNRAVHDLVGKLV